MNALGEPVAARQDSRTESSRLREIPYNYTSFSDREIVIRLLGAPMWALLETLRGERRTGRSARMLFEVLGDIWVVERNPYLQDDLLDNPRRRKLLVDALRHRLNEIDKRRAANADADAERDAKVAQLDRRCARCGRPFRGVVSGSRGAAQARAAHARPLHAQGQHHVRRPRARVARDRRDRLARRVSVRRAASGHRGRSARPRGGMHRARPHDHSARRRHRLHGRRDPARPALGGDQHREARATVGDRAGRAARAHADRRRPSTCGAGVVTKRAMDVADANGLVFACDPTSADASCIGGNVADERRRQEGGAVGNRARQPRLVAHGDARRASGSRSSASTTTSARSTTRRGRTFELALSRRRRQNAAAQAKRSSFPARSFARPASGKDVTDKFLAGLPGVQKEGCDGIVVSARFILHRMPPAIRTVCLEFFGQARDSTPAIVEIKRFLDAAANAPAGQRVLLAGLEHLDERYVKAVGYATKAKRHGGPKMVLIGDIVGESDDAVAKAASEVIRIANARGGEGFVAVSAEARKKFWLDRSRTAAIAKHTNAFKINEDVVIPLERLGDYTDGIERLNIEMSIRNKLKLADRLAAFFARPDAEHLWRPGSEARPGDEALERRSTRRAHWSRMRARAGRIFSTASTRRFATCRTTRSSCRGRPSSRRRSSDIFAGAHVRAAACAVQRHSPRSAAQSRVHRAAHARGRRQRAHQHSGEFRRLRDAAGGERRGRAHHGARARARRRDLRRARHRHHQARVPDGRGAGAVRRLQAPRRSARTLQPRQAYAAAGACGGSDQRVHAVLLR